MAWDAEAPTGALIARCPARYVFLSRPLLWYICEDKVCTIAQKQAKHTIDPVLTLHIRGFLLQPQMPGTYTSLASTLSTTQPLRCVSMQRTDSTLLDCIMYAMQHLHDQAFYQALPLSVSLGTCIRDPIYQEACFQQTQKYEVWCVYS